MLHCVQQYVVDKNYAWNLRERFVIEMYTSRMYRISLNII